MLPWIVFMWRKRLRKEREIVSASIPQQKLFQRNIFLYPVKNVQGKLSFSKCNISIRVFVFFVKCLLPHVKWKNVVSKYVVLTAKQFLANHSIVYRPPLVSFFRRQKFKIVYKQFKAVKGINGSLDKWMWGGGRDLPIINRWNV